MAKTVKVALFASYNGHATKPNGIIELSMKTKYSELTNSVKMLQMLNENISVYAKIEAETQYLGSFNLNNVNIDHDGGSVIKLKSNIDNAECNTLNDLAHNKEEMKFMFKAEIDIDEDEDGE